MDTQVLNTTTTNTFTTGLEDILMEQQKILAAAEEKSSLLHTQISEAQTAAAEAEKNLRARREQHAEAVSRFTLAEQQQETLRLELEDREQKLRESITERRAAMQNSVAEAARQLRQYSEEQENASADSLEAEKELARKRDTVPALRAEQEARHRILWDEYNEICRQYTSLANDAAERHSRVQVEREAAHKAAELAKRALDKTTALLAEADEEITAREEQIDLLQQSKTNDLEALKAQNAADLSVFKKRAEEAAKAAAEKQSIHKKAASFANLSHNLYLDIEKRVVELAQNITAAGQAKEEEAAGAAAEMEQALRAIINEREDYVHLLDAYNRAEEAAAKAEKEAMAARDKVQRLRIDDSDLHNASLVANDLAADATVARINADANMQPMMETMERELLRAAQEAKRLSREKTAELHEAEAAEKNYLKDAEKRRQAAREAKKRLDEAERSCHLAEQAMRELSARIEQRAQEYNSTDSSLTALRSEYEQATYEASILKESSVTAGHNLRGAKQEAEQTERALAAAERNASQCQTACEAKLAEAEEKWQIRLSECYSLLKIARDKRDKIYAEVQKKQDLLQARLDYLEMITQKELAVGEELQQNKTEAERTLAARRQELDRILAADQEQLAQAADAAEEATARYEQALQISLETAQHVLVAKDALAELENQQITLEQSLTDELSDALTAAQEQLAAAASICLQHKNTVDHLNDLIRLAEIDKEQAEKNICSITAALEAEMIRIEFNASRFNEIASEHAAMIAAEEKRQAELKAAAELARRRAEEELQRKEEEERLAREKETQRRREEQEAALIAAEAEQARLAAEEEERRLAAEEEAVRMAAGEVLDEETNLARIASGELKQRIEMMAEIAADEALEGGYLWLDEEQAAAARAEALRLTEQANEAGKMFEAAQTTTVIMGNHLTAMRSQRHDLGPRLADNLLAIDQLEAERAELLRAQSEFEATLASLSATARSALEQAGTDITNSLEQNAQKLAEARQRLEKTEQEITVLDHTIEKSSVEYAESCHLLHEIACKWIYYENIAMKERAKVASIDQASADRAEIKRAAEERFAAAREAAAVSESPRHIRNVPAKRPLDRRLKKK